MQQKMDLIFSYITNNSQIPRGQGPQGEDGLYEKAEDTRNSVLTSGTTFVNPCIQHFQS